MNAATPWPLDHIGIAVADMPAAIAHYQQLMGLSVAHEETLTASGVHLVFLSLGNTSLELLAPVGTESKIAKFLQSRGPGLHHVCYRVPDIRAAMRELSSQGVQWIDSEPRTGAEDSLIAFAHPDSFGGVLTEFCERK